MTLRHNELRDLNIEMVNTADFTHTVKEPTVKDSDMKGEGGLKVEWSVRFLGASRVKRCSIAAFSMLMLSLMRTHLSTLF